VILVSIFYDIVILIHQQQNIVRKENL